MATAQHKARKHHPFSPSKLGVYEACPKFKGLEGTNEAAERGTLMHEASETLDFTKLTEEESEAVHDYLAFIADAKDAMPGCTELTEIQVSIDDMDTTSGFLDKVLLSADMTFAHVIDLKTGYGDIEDADSNLQGLAYAIGVRRRHPTVRRVKVSFFMPRQARSESTAEFTAEELDAAYARIVAVVRKAKRAKYSKGFEMAVPHTGTCRFCEHLVKNRCQKAAGIVSQVGKHMPIQVFSIEEMTTATDPVKLGQILDLLKFIDEVSKPIKARITEMVKMGHTVQGYGLSCISEREVVDAKLVEKIAVEEMTALGDLDPEATLDTCRKLSLSAVESELSNLAPKGAKQKAKELFRERILESGAVVKSTPKVFLKRDAKAEPLPDFMFKTGGEFTGGLPSLTTAIDSAESGSNGKMYF